MKPGLVRVQVRESRGGGDSGEESRSRDGDEEAGAGSCGTQESKVRSQEKTGKRAQKFSRGPDASCH